MFKLTFASGVTHSPDPLEFPTYFSYTLLDFMKWLTVEGRGRNWLAMCTTFEGELISIVKG